MPQLERVVFVSVLSRDSKSSSLFFRHTLPGFSTKAGRCPVCSWPACGVEYSHTISPASGTLVTRHHQTSLPTAGQNQQPHADSPGVTAFQEITQVVDLLTQRFDDNPPSFLAPIHDLLLAFGRRRCCRSASRPGFDACLGSRLIRYRCQIIARMRYKMRYTFTRLYNMLIDSCLHSGLCALSRR